MILMIMTDVGKMITTIHYGNDTQTSYAVLLLSWVSEKQF